MIKKKYSLVKTAAKKLTKRFKTAPRETQEFTNVKLEDMSFDLDTTYKDDLVEILVGEKREDWEYKERKISTILGEKSKVIFDIGSNIGIYSILYSKVNPNSMIYAFEPYSTNADQLRRNVALNKLTNIEVIEKAVGDISKLISFYIPDDESTTTVTSANEAFTQGWHLTKSIQIPQITIDEFVAENRLENVDLIKLDVEYYELQALKGAIETLKRQKPVVICEVHIYEVLVDIFPNMKDKLDEDASWEIEKLLKSIGYYFYILGNKGILRVETMHVHPDERNFLCSPYKSEKLFMPYLDKQSIWKLLP